MILITLECLRIKKLLIPNLSLMIHFKFPYIGCFIPIPTGPMTTTTFNLLIHKSKQGNIFGISFIGEVKFLISTPKSLFTQIRTYGLNLNEGIFMEFKILKSEFLQALNQIQGVVEKKNVMPVLANVLLDAEENLLKISATDLEVALHVLTQAEVKTPGKITVLARKLFDIVREAAGEEIQISVLENDRVEIKSLQTQCKIMALPANEFPKLPEPEGAFTMVATEDFLDMLDKVGFAMSSDETRYHLNGIFLDHKDDESIMVATDGHRLSLTRRKTKLPKLPQTGLIIPRKGVAELRKLVATQKGFELSIGKRHIFVRTERQTLFIRLIDGDFPNYSRVIPEDCKIKVAVPREPLMGALRRVVLLADEYSKGVKLYFCHDVVLVNTTNLEMGEAREEIALDYKDEALEVSFNARYLLDVLGVLKDEKVTLSFNDKSTPCVISSPSDAGFVSVIMPMRV